VIVAACSDDDGGSAGDAAGSDAAPQQEDGGGGPLARYADYESVNYGDPAHWLCRPGADDACGGDLTATVVEAGGTTVVEEFVPADDPPVDCFYVYPTISRDETHYSDWDASPEEEGYVVLHQAARARQQVPRLRTDLPPADADRTARFAGGTGPAGRARR
jgi:hypothetical protein